MKDEEQFDNEVLIKGMNELGHLIEEKELERFKKYYCLLKRWNKKVNLTKIDGWTNNVIYNFFDSISILDIIKGKEINNEPVRVIDLGTGAGLPSIPIKILFDDLRIDMVESKRKKCYFLSQVVRELNITEIKILNNRIEDLGRNHYYKKKYNFGLCRALGSVIFVAELGFPLLKVGGKLILHKGKSYYEDLRTNLKGIKILGGVVENVVKYHLPSTDLHRYIIVLLKERETDEIYPRKYKRIKKEPFQ